MMNQFHKTPIPAQGWYERIGDGLIKVVILLAIATVAIGLASLAGGCSPAQEGGEGSSETIWPSAAIQEGEVQAHVTLETAQGPVLIELGTGYASVEGSGAESVRVQDWGASGRLKMAVNNSSHDLLVEASGTREGEGWAHCVEGEYASGGVTVHGAVPGLQCPTSGIQVSMGASSPGEPAALPGTSQ